MNRRRAQAGFVLVATLGMLVVLSILAGTVAAITQRLRDDELERQRQLEDRIAMASTRATVFYLLATQRVTLGGLTVDDRVVLSLDQEYDERATGNEQIGIMPVGNEVRLDGTVYEGLPGVHFSLQDDRGLIGINWAGDAIREAWLRQVVVGGQLGMPMTTLSNLLLDYQDPDSLYRLNSAEADAYAAAGMPPPSNRALATPLELRRVMGWREVLGATSDMQLVDAVTVVRSPTLNVNTAPVPVLASLPGVGKAMAERAVAARAVRPFALRSEFYGLLGAVPIGEDSVALYPSASGTLKLWPGRGGQVEVLHWTLTPLDSGGSPWREDYEFSLPQDRELAGRVARPVSAEVFAGPATAPP